MVLRLSSCFSFVLLVSGEARALLSNLDFTWRLPHGRRANLCVFVIRADAYRRNHDSSLYRAWPKSGFSPGAKCQTHSNNQWFDQKVNMVFRLRGKHQPSGNGP